MIGRGGLDPVLIPSFYVKAEYVDFMSFHSRGIAHFLIFWLQASLLKSSGLSNPKCVGCDNPKISGMFATHQKFLGYHIRVIQPEKFELLQLRNFGLYNL